MYTFLRAKKKSLTSLYYSMSLNASFTCFFTYSDLVQIAGFWQWVLVRTQWIFMTYHWAPPLTEPATAKTSPASSSKWTSLQTADTSRCRISTGHMYISTFR